MDVELLNAGPVTILLDTERTFCRTCACNPRVAGAGLR
jgi:hypothetical protein